MQPSKKRVGFKRDFTLDFLGIGAEKSGTTWVSDCLAEHPEVYIPKKKEIFFFNEFDPHFLSVSNPKYKWGLNWYKKQFKNSKGLKKGEFSPTYLYCKTATKRIKKHFPDVKLIIVFRNPVKRAFSQYLHDKRIGIIGGISFKEALDRHNSYLEKGFYYKHLSNYLSLFPRQNILIIFLEDIKESPQKTMQKVYKFLGLKNKVFKPRQLGWKSNRATKARFPLLNRTMAESEYFLRRRGINWTLNPIEQWGIRRFALAVRDLNSTFIEKYPKIPLDEKKRLAKTYEKDIKKLQKLLGKDLSAWTG